MRCEQFASVLRITFTQHEDYADLLFFHLRNRGILTYEGRPIFLTTAHTEEDFAKIVKAFDESVRALVAVGLIAGRDPEAIRRETHARIASAKQLSDRIFTEWVKLFGAPRRRPAHPHPR